MIGNNEIRLNQSTMIAAVQTYFETLYKKVPKVLSVTTGSNEFIIKVGEAPQITCVEAP